jgi:hypothetical protein
MSDDERILMTDLLNSIKKYLAQLQQLATAAQTELEKLRDLIKP